MATYRSLSFYIYAVLLVFHIWIHQSNCMYEDQIGSFDWHQSYVGRAKFIFFDQSSHGSRRLVVGSHSGAIATLNARTGAVVWRQVLERQDGQMNVLLHRNKILLSISSQGRLFRRWDLNSGNILWESSLPVQHSSSSPLQSCVGTIGWNNGCIHSITDDEVVTTLIKDILVIHSVSSGSIIKQVNLPYSDNIKYFALHESKNKIYVIGAENQQRLIILSYNRKTGIKSEERSVQSHWISSVKTSCLTNDGTLICTDVSSGSLQTITLASDSEAFQTHSLLSLGVTEGMTQTSYLKPLFDTGLQRREYVIVLSSKHQILAKNGRSNQIAVTELKSQNSLLLSSTTLNSKAYVFSTENFGHKQKINWLDLDDGKQLAELETTFDVDEDRGLPEHAMAIMFVKKDKALSYRVLYVYEDHSIVLLQQNGKHFWSRDEALAEILVAEIVDLALPVSGRLQSLYDEISLGKDGMLSIFFRRISAQLSQLQILIASFKDFPYNIWGEGINRKENKLVRDQFNLRKMIVAVTLSGKLFGIDTASGDIVWKYYLHNLAPINEYGTPRVLLFEQRNTAHYPLPPRCTVLGNAKNDAQKSLIYTFNPLTGKALNENEADGVLVDYKIKQVMILTLTDNHFAKILLMVDPNDQIHISPSTPEAEGAVIDNLESLYLYTVNKVDGQLNGYALSTDAADRIVAKNIWTTRIPVQNQAISLISTKLSSEPVHSQGRVLGNRSVLYKYANPNLLAVATESKDKDKPAIDIFLVDGVTGAIVFQTYQKNARGPVKLVLCEHWVVFHYWNTKYRRYEMAVIELFEGQKKMNESIFSSFMTQLHSASMQSYVFPFDVITMTVTRTEKAITHKDILIGLPGGEILSLPKVLLDPRRPFVLSASDREEGLIQYVPELPFPTNNIINYNRTINGLRKIITSPAGLESTSLVFAYGLDLFYTRVTPSKMFDVLKEDFDYTFISIVVTAMILVSVITAQLSSSSNLKKAWK